MKIQKNTILIFSIFQMVCFTSLGQTRVSTFNIESPQLNTTKKIWIYLPIHYSHEKENYPVLYMHDGQNLFDNETSFAGEWNVDETLDSLKAKVIVIGIAHGNEKRLEELTPYNNNEYGGGKGDDYLDFIVNTLKPYIDKNYRTKSGAKHTAIMGSSLGGLISYYAALKHPTIFGNAILFSPAFWINKDSVASLTKKTKTINSNLYFLCGDSESEAMVSDMKLVFNSIEEKKENKSNHLKLIVVSGGQHNEKLWREEFANAYLWLKFYFK
jgi:predicted alpha/beta superfamily hydrolase